MPPRVAQLGEAVAEDHDGTVVWAGFAHKQVDAVRRHDSSTNYSHAADHPGGNNSNASNRKGGATVPVMTRWVDKSRPRANPTGCLGLEQWQHSPMSSMLAIVLPGAQYTSLGPAIRFPVLALEELGAIVRDVAYPEITAPTLDDGADHGLEIPGDAKVTAEVMSRLVDAALEFRGSGSSRDRLASSGWSRRSTRSSTPMIQRRRVPFSETSSAGRTSMCDDVAATRAELDAKGATFDGDITDEGFGLATTMKLPGAGEIMLYQPQHPTAHDL